MSRLIRCLKPPLMLLPTFRQASDTPYPGDSILSAASTEIRQAQRQTALERVACKEDRPRMGGILHFDEQQQYTASILGFVGEMLYTVFWAGGVQTIYLRTERGYLCALRRTADRPCSYNSQTISFAKSELDIISIWGFTVQSSALLRVYFLPGTMLDVHCSVSDTNIPTDSVSWDTYYGCPDTVDSSAFSAGLLSTFCLGPGDLGSPLMILPTPARLKEVELFHCGFLGERVNDWFADKPT